MNDGIDHNRINAEILRRGMGAASGNERIVYEVVDEKPSKWKTIALSIVLFGAVGGAAIYKVSEQESPQVVAVENIQPITLAAASAVPEISASGVQSESAVSGVLPASSIPVVSEEVQPEEEIQPTDIEKPKKIKRSKKVQELADLKSTIDLNEPLPGQSGYVQKKSKSIYLAKDTNEVSQIATPDEEVAVSGSKKKVVRIRQPDIAAMVPTAIITLANGEQHQIKIGDEYKNYGQVVKIRPDEGIFETATTIYIVKY